MIIRKRYFWRLLVVNSTTGKRENQRFRIVAIISELGQNLSEGELNQYCVAQEIIVLRMPILKSSTRKRLLMRASITIGALQEGLIKS